MGAFKGGVYLGGRMVCVSAMLGWWSFGLLRGGGLQLSLHAASVSNLSGKRIRNKSQGENKKEKRKK
jgi:hypothetical protein